MARVQKSTLPVRTAAAMERILTSAFGKPRFDVVSNPEFLAEGTAVQDLLNPDRVLVGARETPEGVLARKEIVKIYANWVTRSFMKSGSTSSPWGRLRCGITNRARTFRGLGRGWAAAVGVCGRARSYHELYERKRIVDLAGMLWRELALR